MNKKDRMPASPASTRSDRRVGTGLRTSLGRLLTVAVMLATASTLALATGAAAAGPGSTTCANGDLAAGSYGNVTVTGTCSIGGDATISGNVSVAGGATLFLSGAELGGNLSLQDGATMMAFYSTFHGNVGASSARALYIFNSHLDRNLSFVGGGSGRTCTDPDPEASFGNDTMVKDSVIAGNVTFNGWSGCWFGFLRNTVGHNVLIANMYANPENINFPGTPEQEMQGLDSTEVVGNHVTGVLNCTGNTPVAQIGDAEPLPNTARMILGECAALQ